MSDDIRDTDDDASGDLHNMPRNRAERKEYRKREMSTGMKKAIGWCDERGKGVGISKRQITKMWLDYLADYVGDSDLISLLIKHRDEHETDGE